MIFIAKASRSPGLRLVMICPSTTTSLSSHCAPALHLAVAAAAPRLLHMEWFHDHVRIEQMLLEGAPRLKDGHVAADLSAPGHGLSLRAADAERFAA